VSHYWGLGSREAIVVDEAEPVGRGRIGDGRYLPIDEMGSAEDLYIKMNDAA